MTYPEERLRQAIETAAAHDYHKVVIVVGDFRSGKTRLVRKSMEEIGGAYLNLNLELSDQLLAIDPQRYATQASVLVEDLCQAGDPRCPLFVDNLELLFSPEVGRINPVDLFRKISRTRVVVMVLPCRLLARDRAQYSEPGRPDHMILDLSGLNVIDIEGEQ